MKHVEILFCRWIDLQAPQVRLKFRFLFQTKNQIRIILYFYCYVELTGYLIQLKIVSLPIFSIQLLYIFLVRRWCQRRIQISCP